MDKIFEQLTKIEKYARESEVSFASEIEKTNIVASDKLRILREIRKEVSSIISDLTSKVSPLEKQIADLNSDIAAKQSISDKILGGLEEAQDKASRELEDKNKLAAELDVKLDRLQKIISSYISEKDAVSDSLSNARVALDMAELSTEKAKKEAQDAKNELEKAKKELGDISNEKDILNSDIRIKRTMVDELTKSIEKLKTAEKNTTEKRLAELK